MNRRWFVPTAVFAAVLMVAMSIAVGARSITAQDATPAAGDAAYDQPIHIHAGTCAELGEVVFPLTNLTAPSTDGSPVAESSPAAADEVAADEMAEALGSPTAGSGEVVTASTTENVGASLDDIVAGGHAINAHESVDNIANYIACGEVVGDTSSGELTIELAEQNGSGFEGQATLTDNGDGTTTVVVELTLVDGDDATPTA